MGNNFFLFHTQHCAQDKHTWSTYMDRDTVRQAAFLQCLLFCVFKETCPSLLFGSTLKLGQIVYLHRQVCAFLCIHVCILERERERVGQCLTKHVYAYEFNEAHMQMLLNLAAVRGCLVLLDDHSVGESSLLLEWTAFFP